MAGIEGLTQKELRRLSRRDLLVFLLEQADRIEELEQILRRERLEHAGRLDRERREHAHALERQRAEARAELLSARLELERQRAVPAPTGPTCPLEALLRRFRRPERPDRPRGYVRLPAPGGTGRD